MHVKNKKIIFMLLSFLLFIRNVSADDMSSKLKLAGAASSSLEAYLVEVAKNLNDFVVVGFVMVCVVSGISLLFTQENVVKALSKVAFGLFLLKSAVAVMLAVVG